MKQIFKSTVLAVALGLATGVNAATIDLTEDTANGGSDVIVLIQNDSLESLLVNTQINAADMYTGALTSYSSNAQGITADISSFLNGSTNAKFYAFGAMAGAPGVDLKGAVYTFNTFYDVTLTQNSATSFDGFATNANFNEFGADTAGDGPDIENTTGVAALDFQNPSLFPQVTPGVLDTPLVMLGSDFTVVGRSGAFSEATLGSWTLASSGELSYAVSAVPVPAAAWLFGSGLVGLVGVARRRRSA